MKSAEIRQAFLEYFKEQGHDVVPSSSLVPGNDPTLLFTNAGMVQFKDVFLGQEKRSNNRATSSQRCVRAGGKHNDLENVGYTARHHTFFEMLGNFSFGDYFKREAIQFAWNFLTKEMGLSEEKLWVTVFEDDDEAAELWLKEIGVDPSRFSRLGEKDNFWSMGDTGPCGPCTEIFYDHGEDVPGGPPGSPDEDGDRYIEIWNLVFMQFNRSADGSMTPLPKPSVDTGMGLERIAAVMQKVHSNYEIDLFQNIIREAIRITGTSDLDSNSLNVIADHIRSCAFLIVDGVIPANEGRGYVLRRIIRRAIRHGHKLGMNEPFFHKLVAPLVAEMGDAYPELRENQARAEQALLAEEQQFSRTLDNGMAILEKAIADLKGDVIPGETVFRLYDTYGFPVDLTGDIARERGLALDLEEFDAEMGKQKAQARSASHFETTEALDIRLENGTSFTGYEDLQAEASVVGLFKDGKAVDKLEDGESGIVLLDSTPFYAESGGQVGDCGTLLNKQVRFSVRDTQKQGDQFLHIGSIENGVLNSGDKLSCCVDKALRQPTVLNHSATHLMHEALRQTLGDHVQQKGSLVNPKYLRFDFSHNKAVSEAELKQIEVLVNQQILENAVVGKAVMSMDEAKQKGAMALFGEKYGDQVRVISMGSVTDDGTEFSIELCGGTHVTRTGDIGLFKIIQESGIAAGVRRIEAVTGNTAVALVQDNEDSLKQIAAVLKSSQDTVVERVEQLNHANKQLEKELSQLKAKLASSAGTDLAAQAEEINGVKVLVAIVEGLDSKSLRDTTDQLKNKLGTAVVLLATVDGDKVSLVAGVTKDLTDRVKAGELVKEIAQKVGGKGGGRPDMAMAGGNSPDQLPEAILYAKQYLISIL
ncbi:MAG: alanine--tRNA ligase [Gammaproteobacteria bacterium]|jgi:alanyl-tRNA synthetase|nr:alanine--tRNA ligase [Gammaproteobacteria bacterium]